MADFSEEDKVERKQYFNQGVHKVAIMLAEFGETEDAEPKEFVEITVVDPANDDCSDKVRLWFHSTGAKQYSFSTLRSIFVHNAPEDKKDDVRTRFNAIKNTKELDAAIQKMLIGKEAWFSIYESEERTYTAQDGTVKKSYDKNIYGYEPKPKVVTVGNNETKVEGEPVSNDQQPFGF